MGHEIKVSRADFFADVKASKWQKYTPFCAHFYFVCPKGMVGKDELPQGTGLLEYDPSARYRYNSFVVVKTPKINKDWKFEDEFIMRLIMGRWGTEPSQFLKHAAPTGGNHDDTC